jgi:hypothetical protein
MLGYQEKTGQDLPSHDFRKEAFSQAAEEEVLPKKAAVAFDVTAETKMKYYSATDEEAHR